MEVFFGELRRWVQQTLAAIRFPFRGRIIYIEPQLPVQLAQIKGMADEVLPRVEIMQQFGMTSGLPENTDCIVLPLGGKTSHSVIIASENAAFRVRVEPGETCIYNQWGAKITFKQERLVEVECDDFVVNAKNTIALNGKDVSVSKYNNRTGEGENAYD